LHLPLSRFEVFEAAPSVDLGELPALTLGTSSTTSILCWHNRVPHVLLHVSTGRFVVPLEIIFGITFKMGTASVPILDEKSKVFESRAKLHQRNAK
jgi:hypothetical protein